MVDKNSKTLARVGLHSCVAAPRFCSVAAAPVGRACTFQLMLSPGFLPCFLSHLGLRALPEESERLGLRPTSSTFQEFSPQVESYLLVGRMGKTAVSPPGFCEGHSETKHVMVCPTASRPLRRR